MSNQEELSKQLELAIAGLDKKFGRGSVLRVSDEPVKWPAISTGAFSLDQALGIGGIPKGRITELWGSEGVGKSTVALVMTANVQKQGGKCLFIDAEHAVDTAYAQALGVDLDALLFSQPAYGEEALEVLDVMAKTGEIDFIVVDSVAALIPKAELDAEMGTQFMGLQPRMMAQAMRKLPGILHQTNTTVLFINQVRSTMAMYGPPLVQPGGKALKFAASVRIQLTKKDDVKDRHGDLIGTQVEAKIVKNRMGTPFKKAMYELHYGKGIDKVGSIVDAAIAAGVLIKAGAWLKFGDETIAQGRDNLILDLHENEELREKIEASIKNVSV